MIRALLRTFLGQTRRYALPVFVRMFIPMFVVVLLALATTTCAPPPEPGQRTDAAPAKKQDPSQIETQPGGATNGSSDESDAPASSVTPVHVEYEHLNGGIAVPHCPRCGVVFAAGTTTCSGCGLVVAPWNQETLCPQCVGAGVCARCGNDRACLACNGDGVCPYCEGEGQRNGEECIECRGRGRCRTCAGDGWRSVRDGDFLLTETALPGICPTCIDASGLCPDCGGTGVDAADQICPTCAGERTCVDCGGTGRCAHDRGDGLCALCGGSGREIVNGEPLAPTDRIWNIHRASGEVIVGRVIGYEKSLILVKRTDDKRGAELGLVPEKLEPVTYYSALRDHTSMGDPAGRVMLAKLAAGLDLLPLALVEWRRAAADPAYAKKLVGQERDARFQLVEKWLATAKKALSTADREAALRFAQLAATSARDESTAASARALVRSVRAEIANESAELPDADRRRLESMQRAAVARSVEEARDHLERAGQRLRAAVDGGLSDAAVRKAFEEADRAAWAAERLVGAEAQRATPTTVTWPAAPDDVIDAARRLRLQIAVARAATEVAAGRFAYAARLARRAVALATVSGDGDVAHANSILQQAQLGMARRGVLRASPAPEKE